jgi:FkbM family methyltransferase
MNKDLINHYCRKFGFELHGTGYIQRLKKNSFGDDAFAKQRELIETSDPIIFDVGANRGDVAEQYLALFPNSVIHAFEPHPETYSLLRERFENNARVHCHNFAVADDENQREFYVNRSVDTSSLLRSKVAGLSSDKLVHTKEVISVPAKPLDMFASENQIDSIDILKMDIQGGELLALKGSASLLRDKKIKCIYTEVFFTDQYEAQPLFHDISKYLYSFDYTLQDIYSPFYGKGKIVWADAVFLSKDFRTLS